MRNHESIILILVLVAVSFTIHAASGCSKQERLIWEIENGVLTISGWGEMQDYQNKTAPWMSAQADGIDVKSVVVEPGVTYIGSRAFQCFESVKSVEIPNSVRGFGNAAFFNCVKLESVILPKRLVSRELPVSLFDHCASLKNCIIPDGVRTINMIAFNSCEKLERVFIPASVTEIKDGAFNFCISLENVYYAGSSSAWDRIDISVYNESLKTAVIHFNSTLEEYNEALQMAD